VTNRTISRAWAKSDAREESRTPLLDPSKTGFTMTGKGSGHSVNSSADRNVRKAGVGNPSWAISFFATGLSSVTDSVSGSDPTYGRPSISSTAGTCASRHRPPSPSAMLKTMSRGDSLTASRNRGPAGSRRTSCPSRESASQMWPTVASESYSSKASSGRCSGRSAGFTL